mgnify:CR=1 FL=1
MTKKSLFAITIILSVISIFIGVSKINILSLSTSDIEVLMISRLPRLLSILVAGIGMSISGVIMQQISNNKFISPSTAATVDSAKLGVLFSLIIFSSANIFQKMMLSFIFSLLKITKLIMIKNFAYIC